MPSHRRLHPETLTLWLLLLVATGVAARTDVDAEELLMRMSTAVKERTYEGVFVYQRGAQTDSMRIIHRVVEGQVQERLVSLSGSAREVIRDGETVTCIFPEDRSVMVEKSRIGLITTRFSFSIEDIERYYRFSVLGRDRVAGRPTWVVGIEPRGRYRYGYRLWVDEASALLLRSHVVDARGRVLEQIVFTQIALPEAIADDAMEPGISGQDFTWYTVEREARSAGQERRSWQVKWLPAGFSMRDHEVQSIVTSQTPVDHMVFSDGLAMISVFVERLEKVAELRGFSSMGAVNTYSRVFDEHQVTVVGEVPPITVRQIAASIERIRH